MIAGVVLTLAALGEAYPLRVPVQSDALAACMWEKMPTSTAAFVDNTDRAREFTLYLKAYAPCTNVSSKRTVNLDSLRKRLIKIRPAVIGADLATSDNASVCTKGSDGTSVCKPAGE